MSAAGSFQEARDGLRELRKKLDVMDHILGLMATVADSIRNQGQVPELEYNRETEEVALRVRLGLVPPKVSVTMETAEPVTKPSLGDLSDRIQGLDSSGAAEIAEVAPSQVPLEALRVQPPEAEGARPAAGESPAHSSRTRVPCPCMGHDEMCTCQNRIPDETDGAITADPDTVGDGSCGSRQPRADVDATRAGEQASEAEEKAPAAAGESPAPVYKTGEWSVDEERHLLMLHDRGTLLPDMAEALNRRGQGVAAKLRSLLARRSIPKASAVAARVTAAPPPRRPAAPPPAAGPVLQARPRHEREAEARLDAAQDPDWPVARDLDLVERMTRGDGAGNTAAAMGFVKDAVLARWRQLFPNPPTIEEQAAMLAVLRTRVHSQGE
jgi:hypothetical protein